MSSSLKAEASSRWRCNYSKELKIKSFGQISFIPEDIIKIQLYSNLQDFFLYSLSLQGQMVQQAAIWKIHLDINEKKPIQISCFTSKKYL